MTFFNFANNVFANLSSCVSVALAVKLFFSFFKRLFFFLKLFAKSLMVFSEFLFSCTERFL
ncbi:hypothetical protein DP092_00660 [Pseudomonas sp. MDMC224]|nr:hypothetical protein DP092_00660 [Pseudomonas sp. MDMC224]